MELIQKYLEQRHEEKEFLLQSENNVITRSDFQELYTPMFDRRILQDIARQLYPDFNRIRINNFTVTGNELSTQINVNSADCGNIITIAIPLGMEAHLVDIRTVERHANDSVYRITIEVARLREPNRNGVIDCYAIPMSERATRSLSELLTMPSMRWEQAVQETEMDGDQREASGEENQGD